MQSFTSGSFRYKNLAAKQNGGIYLPKARRKSADTLTVSITSYGDLSQASSDMVTHITVGGRDWTVHGIWRQLRSGWAFDRTAP